MKRKTESAVRAGLGYTIGNILIKGINFLTLPVFSRLMSVEEFGVYNVFLAYDSILFVLIGMALHSSVRSAHYEFDEKTDEYVSSISLLYLINLFFWMLLVFGAGNILSEVTGFSTRILYLLILHSFGSSIISLYNYRISLEFEYKKYLLVAAFNSVGSVLLSLFLILKCFPQDRDYGRILGASFALFALAVFLLIGMYRKAKPAYCKKYWKFGISYSLPIIPHGISQVILAQLDRIMISNMVGNTEAGIYSLAGNLKLVLVVITESVSTAWTTWAYERLKEGSVDKLKRRAKQLSYLFAVFAVGLMALSPELVMLIGGSAYLQSRYVVIPMIIDAYVLFLYNVIVPVEYYYKKTVYIMVGTVSAALIDVAANYIFIRQFGYMAAAYTTLFSYLCYLMIHFYNVGKLLKESILSGAYIIGIMVLLSVLAVFDTVWMNNLLARYLLCAVVVLPIILRLLKDCRVSGT